MTGSNLNRKSRTDTDLFHQLAHFSLEFSLKNENKDSKLLLNPISTNKLFASPLTLSLNCLLELVFLSLDIKVFSNFAERRAKEGNTRIRKRLGGYLASRVLCVSRDACISSDLLLLSAEIIIID